MTTQERSRNGFYDQAPNWELWLVLSSFEIYHKVYNNRELFKKSNFRYLLKNIKILIHKSVYTGGWVRKYQDEGDHLLCKIVKFLMVSRDDFM